MGGNDGLGKKAEVKVKEWLDHPDLDLCFDRIPDQLSGFYGSKNICDFTFYKYPYYYYIESKASWGDSFPFSMISENQRTKMCEKAKIKGVRSILIFLYATYQRAFIFNVTDIQNLLDQNIKSLNIKKRVKWTIPTIEIPTIQSRKELLDYQGDLTELVEQMS